MSQLFTALKGLGLEIKDNQSIKNPFEDDIIIKGVEIVGYLDLDEESDSKLLAFIQKNKKMHNGMTSLKGRTIVEFK